MTRKLKKFIPQTEEEMTVEWLTECFRESGIANNASVISFSSKEPESGEGFSGLTLRVDLEWDNFEEGIPKTVLVKFPSTDSKNRALLERDGAYDREFDFYERFSDRFPVKVPKLFYSVRDPISDIESRRKLNKRIELLPNGAAKFLGGNARKFIRPSSRRYALITEFIEGARTTTTENLAPEKDLFEILDSLAIIHAHWWRHPLLDDDKEGVAWPVVTHTPKLMNGLYRGSRESVIERNPELFNPDMVRLTDWFSDNVVNAVSFLNEKMTLLRGDTRTDNMLFTNEGLVMVDFGSFSSGRPSCDVANLLSSCIEPSPNSFTVYQQLSDFYFESLVSNGVTEYSKAQHENDMQVCLALQAYLLVLAAAHYEADYGESSLVKIWSERLTGLIPSTSPLLEQVAVV
ncbi:MAG: ecdysteroid 22-kinase family protein [Acidimicrobiales bacterium]|nr:ecdysteroid 22-kinase family protein [Acidimicrobiales bacterium]